MSYITTSTESSKEVVDWINKFFELFKSYNSDESYESLRKLFRAGYCIIFAHILKDVFKRGTVCWAAPFSHFIWVDVNAIPYDCEGVYDGEAFYFIPEAFLPQTVVNGFYHNPNVECINVTPDDLILIMKEYCKLSKIVYNPKVETYLNFTC